MNDEVNHSQIKVSTAQVCANTVIDLCSYLKKSWGAITKTASQNYNKKWKNIIFKVSDWVWLSERNIKTKRSSKKLDYKYHESFKILAAIRSCSF